MANISIKLDLQKLQGAFIANIKGRSQTKRCLCLPITEAGLFEGKKGTYLDLTGVELREGKFGDTHCIKQQVSKEKFQEMTEDERKQIPIIGGLHEIAQEPQREMAQGPVGTGELEPGEDLPF